MKRSALHRKLLWLWIVSSIGLMGGVGQAPSVNFSSGDIVEAQEDFSSLQMHPRPAILVNKTANVSSGAPDNVIKFVIVVTNTGEVDFDQVFLQDLLPGGIFYLDSNSRGDVKEKNVTWDLGTLVVGESKSVELTAGISGTHPGSLINHAYATGALSTGEIVSDEAEVEVEVALRGEENLTIPEPSRTPPETAGNAPAIPPWIGFIPNIRFPYENMGNYSNTSLRFLYENIGNYSNTSLRFRYENMENYSNISIPSDSEIFLNGLQLELRRKDLPIILGRPIF